MMRKQAALRPTRRWDGQDEAHPDERTTDAGGNAEFPAPPRDYLCLHLGLSRATVNQHLSYQILTL
jgi:hypothetical protein